MGEHFFLQWLVPSNGLKFKVTSAKHLLEPSCKRGASVSRKMKITSWYLGRKRHHLQGGFRALCLRGRGGGGY